MPPRKRRQSVYGDINEKDSAERQLSPQGIASEGVRNYKACNKIQEPSNNTNERRLTARQLSKQEAHHESLQADKPKDLPVLELSTVTAVPASLESGPKQPTRFSTRIVKRPRKDISPPESPVKKGRKSANVPIVSTTPETKGKRQWELWSVEDKDSFFEGLCEYGKDFESIHNLIVTKCKKKGSVMPITVKNKEQVRHFYYRTWHKISKLIQPVEDLKKDIQELYGLISYSVLRKKLRGGVNPNDKNWQKLNDLVHQGAATIKVKGKKIRVKTPVCNALKKLNSYEETKRDPGPRVPEKIKVEFHPRTNAAWQRVQDQSHNPRVRVTVGSECHLQSLIKYLEQKWKPHRVRIKDGLNENENSLNEFRVYPNRDCTLRKVGLTAIDEPVLQFSLSRHCKDGVTSPSIGKRKKDRDCVNLNKSITDSAFNSENPCDNCKSVIKCGLNSCECKGTCSTNLIGELIKQSNDIIIPNAGRDDTSGCNFKCNTETNPLVTTADKNLTNRENTGDGIFSFSDANCDLKMTNKYSPVAVSVCDEQIKNFTYGMTAQCVTYEDTRIRSTSCCTSSVNELNMIADGENAMFPDTITSKACCDSSVLDRVSECASSGSNMEHGSPDTNKKLENRLQESPDGKHLECKNETQSNDLANNLSSQQDYKLVFKDMLENGISLHTGQKVTLAELYLMFGEDGELKLEYEWINLRMEANILQERLLLNLNNMLRRLSHLAAVEFTDFTRTPNSNAACTLCGLTPGTKSRSQGKGRSHNSYGGAKASKDVSTQTTGFKQNPISVGLIPTSCQNGVFRIPVLPTTVPSQPAKTTMSLEASRELMQKLNPVNNPKQLMRPRKVKPMMRQRPGQTSSLIQRTILPKNSEYVAIFPMIPGAQIQNLAPNSRTDTQMIVGHPINGIQTQSVNMISSLPMALMSHASPGVTDTSSPSTSLQCSSSMMEIFDSHDGDQTLMRIPESHIGSMSHEALKAAGLSTVPNNPGANLFSVISTPFTTAATVYTDALSSFTPMAVSSKGSLSPPNLSSFLDISLASGDLEAETSFTNLLGEPTKPLSLDSVLTTHPIHALADQQPPTSSTLHSPPVRSLFVSSPMPDHQWLNSDVNDLSLTGLLESPSKPSASCSSSMFNTHLPLSLFNENSRDFQSHKLDVDSTLHCMMNESSIDYVKKFADLAEQIVQNDTQAAHLKKS